MAVLPKGKDDWLEGRGPYLSLIAAIDDAPGKMPYAVFRLQEDAQGYFLIAAGGHPKKRYSSGVIQRPPWYLSALCQ